MQKKTISANQLMPPHIGSFDIAFPEPDQYGESHSRLEIPLSLDKEVVYMDLKINGEAPIKFHFYYHDAER